MVENKVTYRKILAENKKLRETKQKLLEWVKMTFLSFSLSVILYMMEIEKLSLLAAFIGITCLFMVGKNAFSIMEIKSYLKSLK